MKLFEDSFSYSNQLGQRQGAGVVYLNVFHPDIEMFLSAKKKTLMKNPCKNVVSWCYCSR